MPPTTLTRVQGAERACCGPTWHASRTRPRSRRGARRARPSRSGDDRRPGPRRSSSTRRRRTRSPRSSTRSPVFPSVQRVDVAGRTGLTRDDFADVSCRRSWSSRPRPGAVVPLTFQVTGTRQRVRGDARRRARPRRQGARQADGDRIGGRARPRHVRGDLHAPSAGPATRRRAFAPSAADGSPQHEVDVPVTVKP